MKRVLLFCSAMLMLSVPALAQDLPKAEVSGGYGFTHTTLHDSDGDVSVNLNGWFAGGAFYAAKTFGLAVEIGRSTFSSVKQAGATFPIDGSTFTYLVGPRVRMVRGRATPFAQALLGGMHRADLTSSSTSLCGTVTRPCTLAAATNGFAMAITGGVDVTAAPHLAIRGQAGYAMARIEGETNNSLVFSAGLVIR